MVYDFLPFMILPLYTTLSKIDGSLYEASADLGGNSFTTFTRVTVPLSMPGVLSGMDDGVPPLHDQLRRFGHAGNSKVTIIGKFIETYFGTDYSRALRMIALILLVIVLASTLLTGGFQSEHNVRGTTV